MFGVYSEYSIFIFGVFAVEFSWGASNLGRRQYFSDNNNDNQGLVGANSRDLFRNSNSIQYSALQLQAHTPPSPRLNVDLCSVEKCYVTYGIQGNILPLC